MDSEDSTGRKSLSGYAKKMMFMFKFFSGLIDQIYDFYTIALVSMNHRYGFALLFMLADLCPALAVMWEKYKSERSWRILRFCFQPANLLIWNVKALIDQKDEATFMLIKSAHSVIEAPFQIILTMTLMSMGIITLPGSEEKTVTNAYNIRIDLTWLPIVSTTLSFFSILASTRNIFNPRNLENNIPICIATFTLVFAFRMVVWIMVAITLERFTLIVLGSTILTNTLVLFLIQRDQMTYNPIYGGLLSVVIPTHSVKALYDLRAEENGDRSLKVLLSLVLSGNVLLLLSFAIVYILYFTSLYNPWCIQDIATLRLEEDFFYKCPAFIVTLFLGATLPIVFVYVSTHARRVQKFFLANQKSKKWFLGWLLVLLFAAAFSTLSHVLRDTNYAPQIKSTKYDETTDKILRGWSDWERTSSGVRRERTCRGFILEQKSHQITGYTRVAVALGSITDEEFLDDIEVFDLTNENIVCQNLPNFPYNTTSAAGGLEINDKPIICGGLRNASACHVLENGDWLAIGSMNEGRTQFSMTRASFGHNKSHLFVTGGEMVSDGSYRTSEFLSDNKWQFSVRLPVRIYLHCAVQVNFSTVMVIGGYQENHKHKNSISGSTFLFNSISRLWSEGPELQESRAGHSCGMVTKNSRHKSTVAIGGMEERDLISSVEILDAGSLKWRWGPDLPFGIFAASIIEDRDGGIILIGGSAGNRLHDTFFRLPHAGVDATWIELPHKLTRLRYFHTAFLLPDNLTDCAERIIEEGQNIETNVSKALR